MWLQVSGAVTGTVDRLLPAPTANIVDNVTFPHRPGTGRYVHRDVNADWQSKVKVSGESLEFSSIHDAHYQSAAGNEEKF